MRQLKETKAKFLLIDEETAPQMQVAAAKLDWKVKFVTFKKLNVPNSVSVEDLMQDDGTGTYFCLSFGILSLYKLYHFVRFFSISFRKSRN